MLWFYIPIFITIIVAVAGFVICMVGDPDFGEAFSWFFGSTFFGVVFGGLFFIIMNAGMSIWIDDHWVESSEVEIAALQDVAGVSGSFFLGSGTIDNEPVFFYYEESDGAYRLRHVDADSASVVEVESNFRLEVFEKESDNEFLRLLDGGARDARQYTFYVPNGSIVNNFSLDAQ